MLPQIVSTGVQILLNLAQGAVTMLLQLLVVGMNAISQLLSGVSAQLPTILQKKRLPFYHSRRF